MHSKTKLYIKERINNYFLFFCRLLYLPLPIDLRGKLYMTFCYIFMFVKKKDAFCISIFLYLLTQKYVCNFGLVWFGLAWFGLVWFGFEWNKENRRINVWLIFGNIKNIFEQKISGYVRSWIPTEHFWYCQDQRCESSSRLSGSDPV